MRILQQTIEEQKAGTLERDRAAQAERLAELAAKTPEGNYLELSERYASKAQEERQRDPGTSAYYQSLADDYAELATEHEQEPLTAAPVCQGIMRNQPGLREAFTPRGPQRRRSNDDLP